MNHESHYGPHSLFAALCAGVLGPIFDHWLMRYVVCAAIGLLFSLVADWLRPAVARHGRKVAGERPTDPPSGDRKETGGEPEIPVEEEHE